LAIVVADQIKQPEFAGRSASAFHLDRSDQSRRKPDQTPARTKVRARFSNRRRQSNSAGLKTNYEIDFAANGVADYSSAAVRRAPELVGFTNGETAARLSRLVVAAFL